MKTYALTVFDKAGEKLLDEHFDAANNDEAKEKGTARLTEKDFLEHTHRCVTSTGTLVLFHR